MLVLHVGHTEHNCTRRRARRTIVWVFVHHPTVRCLISFEYLYSTRAPKTSKHKATLRLSFCPGSPRRFHVEVVIWSIGSNRHLGKVTSPRRRRTQYQGDKIRCSPADAPSGIVSSLPYGADGERKNPVQAC